MIYTNDNINERKKRINIIKKVISITVYVMLVPLLIYNISLIIQSIVNPKETPSFIGIKSYVVISGSMLPEYDIGDIVIVKKVGEDSIKVGDVISFREGQQLITHRVIDVYEKDGAKEYVTKGDNNNTEDSNKVVYSNIEGRCIFKIPKVGKITLLLKNKVMIIVIFLFFYIIDSRQNKKEKLKQKRKEKRLEYERKMVSEANEARNKEKTEN